jgi:hypothetical protein
MITLNTLHSFESGCMTVSDILCTYFDVRRNRLMHTLTEDDNDMVCYWASCNDCTPSDIMDCIDSHLNDSANFKVVNDCGSGGGWPDCELKLGSIVLNFDWVTDD